ncbi:MAG: phBC6A51 family helix-turn-helix protein [Romboutsia timonensis]
MALKAKHYQFIELLMANPMIPDTEVAKLMGVSRNTVAEWKKKPEFQEELKKRLREKWEDSERLAVETMQSLAREGDFKASKYILDSLGYAPVQKIEADINKDIVINIEE